MEKNLRLARFHQGLAQVWGEFPKQEGSVARNGEQVVKLGNRARILLALGVIVANKSVGQYHIEGYWKPYVHLNLDAWGREVWHYEPSFGNIYQICTCENHAINKLARKWNHRSKA